MAVSKSVESFSINSFFTISRRFFLRLKSRVTNTPTKEFKTRKIFIALRRTQAQSKHRTYKNDLVGVKQINVIMQNC